MKISYTILAYNEIIELKKLLDQLTKFKKEDDEILVLIDNSKKIPNDMFELLKKYDVEVYQNLLNNNFANQKNFISKKCTGDYIVNIDADELLSEYLLQNIHEILETNKDIDVIRFPRINTVEEKTMDDIRKYGWKINKNGFIGFPDFQMRCYKNKPEICWVRPVHEILNGFKTIADLPEEEKYCIIHHKKIEKQREQNKLYSEIIKSLKKEN